MSWISSLTLPNIHLQRDSVLSIAAVLGAPANFLKPRVRVPTVSSIHICIYVNHSWVAEWGSTSNRCICRFRHESPNSLNRIRAEMNEISLFLPNQPRHTNLNAEVCVLCRKFLNSNCNTRYPVELGFNLWQLLQSNWKKLRREEERDSFNPFFF